MQVEIQNSSATEQIDDYKCSYLALGGSRREQRDPPSEILTKTRIMLKSKS